MRISKIQLFMQFSLLTVFFACGSPIDRLADKQLKAQNSQAETGKLGTFGKVVLSKKNFNFYNMDGRVYTFEEAEDMPVSLREEIYRRELLRREIIRRGQEEKLFQDAEAEAYIWPRMEKILEEYYHYKKQNYPALLKANKLRFSGEKAIEKFYEKNQATFVKDKLSVEDIKNQIGKRIQILTEKEYEEKKLRAIQDIMKSQKVEIIR